MTPRSDQPPLFDVVMGDAVPTFHRGAPAHAAAHRSAMDAVRELNATDTTPDPACAGDGACPECGDVDPGPYDHSDPCRACGAGPAREIGPTPNYPVSTDSTVRADAITTGDVVWDGAERFRTVVSAYVEGDGFMRVSFGRRVDRVPVASLYVRRSRHFHAQETTR